MSTIETSLEELAQYIYDRTKMGSKQKFMDIMREFQGEKLSVSKKDTPKSNIDSWRNICK